MKAKGNSGFTFNQLRKWDNGLSSDRLGLEGEWGMELPNRAGGNPRPNLTWGFLSFKGKLSLVEGKLLFCHV